MTSHASKDPDHRLLPAGSRWGRGASSVVPYLYVSLLTRPLEREGEGDGDGHFISNPVFPHMENTLRVLRGH